MGKFVNLTGLVFSRLTVLERIGVKNRSPLWACKCECGSQTVATSAGLRRRYNQSCGCLAKEMRGEYSKTHGMSNTPEYRAWAARIGVNGKIVLLGTHTTRAGADLARKDGEEKYWK